MALLRRADHQYLCLGHSRGIPSVPGSFSDPRPAGLLMVMVITGPNCEQWNYEISKFAATMLLASTHRPFLSAVTTTTTVVAATVEEDHYRSVVVCGGDRREDSLNSDGRRFIAKHENIIRS